MLVYVYTCIRIYAGVHVCLMCVYCGVYTCTRVCLCEFICLVACCSVSVSFGEIRTVAGDPTDPNSCSL